MKKMYFALISAAILMVSCSGNKNNGNVAGGNSATAEGKIDAKEVVNEEFKGEKKTKEAAEFYFNKFAGIKLDQLSPAFTPTKTDYMGEKHNAAVIFTSDKEITDDATQTYAKKVFELTKNFSDDKFNFRGLELESDNKVKAKAEWSDDDMIKRGKELMGSYQWGFRWNGRIMHVYVDNYAIESKGIWTLKASINPGMEMTWDEMNERLNKAAESGELDKTLKNASKK